MLVPQVDHWYTLHRCRSSRLDGNGSHHHESKCRRWDQQAKVEDKVLAKAVEKVVAMVEVLVVVGWVVRLR